MLARSMTWVGLCCLALCACGEPKSKTTQKPICNADGGCADAEAESGEGAAGAAAMSAAGSGARRTRVQPASALNDAGAAGRSAQDSAQPTPTERKAPSNPDTMRPADAGSADTMRPARAGAAAPMMEMEAEPAPEETEEPVDAGAQAEPAEPTGNCDEQSCDACHACGESGSCEPVTGQDDADSCGDTRSCSSRGECLHVSEGQPDLGTMSEYVDLTTSYAQVINFSEPASVVEIRLEVSCTENDQTFPTVWIAAAPGGIPSSTVIATANVIPQAPSETNAFALLELSKVLEQPDTGPIAIVVNQTDMSCIARVNTEEPYSNGALFSQRAADLWLPTDGSLVFQVLSSQ